MLPRLHTCSLCEKAIPSEKRICKDCNKEILGCSWILTCNCEEDNCMALCRDCPFNGKMKSDLKKVLGQLRQEMLEC